MGLLKAQWPRRILGSFILITAHAPQAMYVPRRFSRFSVHFAATFLIIVRLSAAWVLFGGT